MLYQPRDIGIVFENENRLAQEPSLLVTRRPMCTAGQSGTALRVHASGLRNKNGR
jgi:hypothetical protein